MFIFIYSKFKKIIFQRQIFFGLNRKKDVILLPPLKLVAVGYNLNNPNDQHCDTDETSSLYRYDDIDIDIDDIFY